MADRVALIDYGAGNLHSVHNALKAAGVSDVAVTDDPAIVRAADRIVLPGVGAFAACMNGLSAIPGMIDALEQRVRGDKVPFLGICVGMQLLAERGLEHGTHAGLGWIAGEVRAMEATPAIKVPHMGWNDVTPLDSSSSAATRALAEVRPSAASRSVSATRSIWHSTRISDDRRGCATHSALNAWRSNGHTTQSDRADKVSGASR